MAIRFKDSTQLAKLRTREQLKKFMIGKGLQIQRAAADSMIGGGQPHQPSLPGQPPRVDTGTLRRSIQHEVNETPKLIEVRVGTNEIVGLYLELGTVHIEPRPWLLPAFLSVIR